MYEGILDEVFKDVKMKIEEGKVVYHKCNDAKIVVASAHEDDNLFFGIIYDPITGIYEKQVFECYEVKEER